MNETVIIIGVFVLSLMVFGALGAAIASAGPSNRAIKNRLLRYRQRFGQRGLTQRSLSAIVGQTDMAGIEQLLHRLMPRPEEFRKLLQQAGLKLSLTRYAALSLLCGAVGGGVAYGAFGMPVAISLLSAAAIALWLPYLVIRGMVRRRQSKFLALFPDAIDLMVRGLRSGLPVNETIEVVASEISNPVGEEFRRIADQARLGKTLEDALWSSVERLDFPDFKFFVIALNIQRETGGNLAETLENLSKIIRQRQQLKLKINALSSEGRASAMIIGVLPFIMFGIIYAMSPSYASVFFEDPRAKIALFGGLIWMGTGLFIIRKMIRFEV